MSTLKDPRTLFEAIEPPAQIQEEPGLETEATPVPDIGLDSYVGHGRLKGRKALITGGDSGIGAAVAIAYAREGADVAISYLPSEQKDADRVIKAIEDAGQKALALPGDLIELEQCEKIVAETVKAFGGLDILVNNASRQRWQEKLTDITDEEFDKTMKANVYSSFRVTKAALPHLEPGSAILFTSSVNAYSPSPTLIDYGVTKAAMNNLAKGLSEQLVGDGIRVNCVAPGPVWTVLQPSHGQPQEKVQEFGRDTGLGRAGQPVEMAGAYVYLASDEASFVTGETIVAAGGGRMPF
ncbi:SDR family oxidoreductase [Corynebacterium tapiri]|uniref:SDR family oxidoreductase n=1 Tax=Corynebacterium tapiri TaxID=1448266 RepID=A0A5C4U5B1_9CORY|nr:SDR family oxidoreductase [Corynebacterium tapiri]TNL99366.1 SDR family oxidoreductase [Corynebacterium tapiri]